MADDVRLVKASESARAAEVLAECFGEDFVVRYFAVGDGMTTDQCRQINIDMFRHIVDAHIIHGRAYTVSDFQGVALWMGPGSSLDSWRTVLLSGMWRLYYKLGRNGRRRYFREFLPLLASSKFDCLGAKDDANSWYLTYIGTLPSARRKGYSRKLIDCITRLADENQQKCYLESSSDWNSDIYRRFGFEAVKTVVLPESEPPINLTLMDTIGIQQIHSFSTSTPKRSLFVYVSKQFLIPSPQLPFQPPSRG